MAGFIGLALLSANRDTAAFLESNAGDDAALVAITFLPTRDARAIAEGIISDAEQKWQTRIQYLTLLRAVGDRGTLEKLKKREVPGAGPYERAALDRTARFLKERLSLEDRAERDRWARQELLFLQMTHSCPNFRSGTFARGWAAEQIHRNDKEISTGLLKAKLSREPAAADDAFRGDVPLAALVAGLQKSRDVLPLLDGWGATDLGFISETCRQVAERLRGRGKR